VIVLFGAEISFTIQNFEDITRKEERRRRGTEGRTYYAVRTVLEICRRFAHAQGPQPADDLAERFDIPEYVVRGICAELDEKKKLTAVAGPERAVLPAKAVTARTGGEVVRAMEGEPLRPVPPDAPRGDAAYEILARVLRGAEGSLERSLGVTFDKLVEDIEEAGGSSPATPAALSPAPPSV